MKIRNFKTRVIAPILLLTPMACMHLGDGHHSGHQHSFATQPSYEGSNCDPLSGWVIEQGIAPFYQESPGGREG